MANEWKAVWRPSETDYLVSCVDDDDAPLVVVRPMDNGWSVSSAAHVAQRIVGALSTEGAGDAERLAADLTEAHATIATQRAALAEDVERLTRERDEARAHAERTRSLTKASLVELRDILGARDGSCFEHVDAAARRAMEEIKRLTRERDEARRQRDIGAEVRADSERCLTEVARALGLCDDDGPSEMLPAIAALRLRIETLAAMVRRCAHATAAEPVLAKGILAELATIEARGVTT